MTKSLIVMGSTGSIGRQTLEVARRLGIRVSVLAAGKNAVQMEEQARQFHPKRVVMTDQTAARDVKIRLADTDIFVAGGSEAADEAAGSPEGDTVVAAIMGIAGLSSTISAIRAHKKLALANKETLVCAGEIVTAEAKKQGVRILPVDSEHSAIFQCLQGTGDTKEIDKLLITASGGPFYGRSFEELESVTPEMALRHPNWSMGAKITIDSATMMNKGLECIEAHWLFGVEMEQIIPVIHRQSLIHSMVEFRDGAILAQLGAPDMRLPIQYALTWPERIEGPAQRVDLLSCGALTFSAPDHDSFPCLRLALEAQQKGGTAPTILSGANEEAVSLFLNHKIGFNDIYRGVRYALEHVQAAAADSLETIAEADRLARISVKEFHGGT